MLWTCSITTGQAADPVACCLASTVAVQLHVWICGRQQQSCFDRPRQCHRWGTASSCWPPKCHQICAHQLAQARFTSAITAGAVRGPLPDAQRRRAARRRPGRLPVCVRTMLPHPFRCKSRHMRSVSSAWSYLRPSTSAPVTVYNVSAGFSCPHVTCMYQCSIVGIGDP
jgi:hypothetical protein